MLPVAPVNKLVLVVTDACNLRCKYCFVNESPHRGIDRSMDSKTAGEIIRRFLPERKHCSLIQFFGGEPTLRFDAIEAAIEQTLILVDSGDLAVRPRFAIVTNGVIADRTRFLELVKKHSVEVTLSLDGPAKIHDALRPTAKRSDTYKTCIQTLNMLQSEGLEVNIESVYTSKHLQMNFSVTDLFAFVQQLGVKKLIFDVAYPPAPDSLNPLSDPYFDKLLESYRLAVDWWFNGLIETDSKSLKLYFRDFLQAILNGIPAVAASGGCAAGQRDFTIGPKGDVYACQLFYKNPNYHLGNVLSDTELRLPMPFPLGTDDILACKTCSARHWCQPCAAVNLSWGSAWKPPQRLCELRRTVVRQLGDLAFSNLVVPENPVTSDLKQLVQH